MTDAVKCPHGFRGAAACGAHMGDLTGYCPVHFPEAPRITWQCDLCSHKFSTQRRWAWHERNHERNGDLPCCPFHDETCGVEDYCCDECVGSARVAA